MSGILGILLAGGFATTKFNLTAGSVTGSPQPGAGYNDGTAGTSGVPAGSVSSSVLSGRHIAELYSTVIPDDRLIVKGFTSDPGQRWLFSLFFPVTASVGPPLTLLGSAATYSYDAVNGAARWIWSGAGLGMISGNTYSNNTITHGG